MNQTQCNELRDSIFASRFQTENNERLFRFLAVTPGGADGAEATVHFAYAPAVFARAGYSQEIHDVISLIEAVIELTPCEGKRFAFQFHDYLRGGWPLPWGITAKDSVNNFPTLILFEFVNGRVLGVLMRDSHCAQPDVHLADVAAEPMEACRAILKFRRLVPDELFMGWYKECNIEADSLDAAIAAAPETENGQKGILIYRDAEWLNGIWNSPMKHQHCGLSLSSVADFHGIRTSTAKRNSRTGIDVARQKQTIAGDYSVLDRALDFLDFLSPENVGEKVNHEALPVVVTLCEWWNANAPQDMQLAATFRIYIWQEGDRAFVAGDPEEPPMQADIMAKMPCYSIFERQGSPTVAIVFYRGSAFNSKGEWGTVTHFANGEAAAEIGLDLNEVDEAYYAVVGLRALKAI